MLQRMPCALLHQSAGPLRSLLSLPDDGPGITLFAARSSHSAALLLTSMRHCQKNCALDAPPFHDGFYLAPNARSGLQLQWAPHFTWQPGFGGWTHGPILTTAACTCEMAKQQRSLSLRLTPTRRAILERQMTLCLVYSISFDVCYSTRSCEATNSRQSTADTTAGGHGGSVESATTLVRTPSLTAAATPAPVSAPAPWIRTRTSSSAQATSSTKKRDWRWGRENTSGGNVAGE
jgi:hypothetical protein